MLEIINHTRCYINRKLFNRALSVSLQILKKKNAPRLELIFITPAMSKKLNALRGKRAAANVLSFPEKGIGTRFSLGQIFITPTVAKREAEKQHKAYGRLLVALFIHGLLHLFGFSHSTMSPVEKKIMKSYNKRT